MEDFVRKTQGVRDISALPLDTNHELDIVSDVKGKIYIKILNRYKELLFDNGTDQWVIDMLNNLEVDVEQLKEDILDVEQVLSELPIIEDKLATVETKLTQINTLFAQMQIDVQGLDLRTAELEREVIQLALKDQELLDKINNLDVDLDILYSNSTDFGEYDYSGNPNLLPKLDFSKLSRSNATIQSPPAYVKDHGTYFEVDMDDPSAAGINRNVFIPLITRLQKGKTYTISANIMISDEMNLAKCPMYYAIYRSLPTPETIRPAVLLPTNDNKNNFVRVSKTFTTPSDMADGDFAPYLQWYFPSDVVGKYYVGYDIKIEEGSTATPYQPNLLDAPYYLSKMALGENIANKSVAFPIKSSAYDLYQADIEEEFIVGQTYTLTIKATKPSTQTFRIYGEGAGDYYYGDLKPLEGVEDIWSLTFTTNKVSANYPKRLQVLQYPSSTIGACQIDWLKIEKGNTRTPNIPYYKYVGINLEASKNPNDYHWIPLAKSAETVDTRLTKTISTYDTVNALQNNRLTSLESKVVDTTWQNVTVTEPFTSVTQPQVKKQNGIVYMRGTISNGTGDCFTLPEGFRPPAGAYEMQFRLPCRSASAADYATIYVRPSGLCSIAGVNGTNPIFLSGIIFSTT